MPRRTVTFCPTNIEQVCALSLFSFSFFDPLFPPFFLRYRRLHFFGNFLFRRKPLRSMPTKIIKGIFRTRLNRRFFFPIPTFSLFHNLHIFFCIFGLSELHFKFETATAELWMSGLSKKSFPQQLETEPSDTPKIIPNACTTSLGRGRIRR